MSRNMEILRLEMQRLKMPKQINKNGTDQKCQEIWKYRDWKYRNRKYKN